MAGFASCQKLGCPKARHDAFFLGLIPEVELELSVKKAALIEDGQWFQPRMLERKIYYFYDYSTSYKETNFGLEGVEALRRSRFDHRQYVMTRKAGDAWIKPVMKATSISRTKTPDRPSDLCMTAPSLVVSERAKDILEPLSGSGTEFLAVEVEDGPDIYWVFAPMVPEALCKEKSNISEIRGVITTINHPVLNRSAIPSDQSFLALDHNYFMPVFSSRIAAAIREHDLYGIGMRQIDVI